MPFWRREPLHEKLAREGGLAPRDGGPLDPRPQIEVGIHGISRPREWDAIVTVEVKLARDDAQFVTLPDGTVLTEDDSPASVLQELANAVETQLSPPYRAEAVRRDGDIWAVAANRVEVVDVPEEIGGDEIELAVQGDERTLLVDGERVFGSSPTLEALASRRHGDAYVVRAVRLDGNLWDVRSGAL